jgi:tetratricopeptide (TPR) repeat protein
MNKSILTVLTASAMSLAGGVRAADTAKAPEMPGRILLQWESQQQINWDTQIKAKGFRFLAVPLAALDTGSDAEVRGLRFTLAPDGATLSIVSGTSWDTGSAVVEIEPGKTGTLSVEIRDPYVKDRLAKEEFALGDLQKGRAIPISSKECSIRNCAFRLTSDPTEVEQETELLKTLGSDRKKNVEALLAAADAAGKASSKERRLALLLRAAAACSGGCNHGPLEPDGWDRAIAIYQKVADEYKGTDAALDALWAEASCSSCWSPCSGCDADGRGKSHRNGREKRDWEKAFELYENLYKISPTPSDKANALRRMAEVQCFEAGDWDTGLRNYKRIAVEFPDALPPSPRWTYRTCAPHCETEELAWDIYRAIVANSKDKSRVSSMFDEYFGDVQGNPHVDELARLAQGISAPR